LHIQFLIFDFNTTKNNLKASKYLGKKIIGLKMMRINHPKKISSKNFVMGACCFVKKLIAAPEQIIKGLCLRLFFI